MKHGVKLPFQVELVISLIMEDLKKRRYFNALYPANLYHDSWYEADLGRLILKGIGITEISKEHLAHYSKLIQTVSTSGLPLDVDDAFQIYAELIRLSKS